MEYSEEYLKHNVIVLSKCIQDMSPVLIEDFRKDEKFISWKKVIGILKHFMAMNKEEEIKLACCNIFLLLVKNQYFDDLVNLTDEDLHGQAVIQVSDEGDPGL